MIGPIVSRLLECLEGDAAPFAGLCETRTPELGVALCVAIHRHRFVVDPQESVPEGTKTLAFRAETLKVTFETTGLDKLLTRIVELKKVIERQIRVHKK